MNEMVWNQVLGVLRVVLPVAAPFIATWLGVDSATLLGVITAGVTFVSAAWDLISNRAAALVSQVTSSPKARSLARARSMGRR